MDVLEQLNAIEDPELQALVTSGLRYALTHNLIASQASAMKDNPQANQAAAIHKETATILDMLIKRLMEDNKSVEKAARKAKK